MSAGRARGPGLVLVLLTVCLAGCGYRTGMRLAEPTSTVGVEVFGNDSKLRDLEVELQRQLVDAVDRLVHAPIVDPSEADLIVRGRIVSYQRRHGIRSNQNELLDSGVAITIEVQLVRRYNQTVIAKGSEPSRSDQPPSLQDDRNSLPRTAPNETVLRPLRASQEFGFILSEPNGEAVARSRTLANLAERFVLDLFGSLPQQDSR